MHDQPAIPAEATATERLLLAEIASLKSEVAYLARLMQQARDAAIMAASRSESALEELMS